MSLSTAIMLRLRWLLQGQKAKQEAGQPKKEAAQAPQGGQEKPKSTKAERRAKQEAERAAKEAGVPKVCYKDQVANTLLHSISARPCLSKCSQYFNSTIDPGALVQHASQMQHGLVASANPVPRQEHLNHAYQASHRTISHRCRHASCHCWSSGIFQSLISLCTQGGGKQAAGKQGPPPAKQGQAGATDKQAAAPTAAQSQAPTQANPAASSKAKPAKQASKVQQQQKGGADSQAMSLPSDVFAHLPQYNVSWTDICLELIVGRIW